VVKVAQKAHFAVADLPDLHHAVTPLYRLQERDAILGEMPSFDQWGHRHPGFVGERPNPLTATSDPELVDDVEEPAASAGKQLAPLRRRQLVLEISSDDEAAAGNLGAEASQGPTLWVEGDLARE
jgi:hypothetical protein